MKLSDIIKNTVNRAYTILQRSWILILGIANINFLYQYLISILISDVNKMQMTVLVYNVLIFPLISLLIMYIIKEKITYSTITKHAQHILKDSQKYYGRLLAYYLILASIKMFLGNGSNFLFFLIVIIKLPFIEQYIYFENKPFWESVKDSFEQTQDNILRSTLILATITIVLYIILVKSIQITNTSSIAKPLSMVLSLVVANVEIIGKVIIISLFLTSQKKPGNQIEASA